MSLGNMLTKCVLILLLVSLAISYVTSVSLPKGMNNYTYPFVNYSMSNKCNEDVDRMMASIKREKWALKMLDSFGKPEDSILEGNNRWAGEFDQCHSIHVEPSTTNIKYQNDFRGRYCWLTWTVFFLSKTLLFQSGGCVPDSCSEADVLALYPYVLEALDMDLNKVGALARLDGVDCLPEETVLTSSAWFTLYCLSAYVGFVLLVSSYDYWERSLINGDVEEANDDQLPMLTKEKDIDEVLSENHVNKISKTSTAENNLKYTDIEPDAKWKEALECFSVFRNADTISDNEGSEKRPLAFLDGIRVLSFICILVIHAENCQRSIDRQILKHHEYSKRFSFQFVLSGHFAVESFFFVSGFCFSYVFLRNSTCVEITLKRFLQLIFHRYLRTSIPMLFLLVIQGVLVNYCSDGPLWQIQEASVAECPNLWWTFVFNIHNFYKMNECCGWLWYVALDFQFYINGLLLLFVFQRSFRQGVLVTLLLILISILVTVTISYAYDMNTYQGYLIWGNDKMDYFEERLNVYFRYLYSMPYCRVGSHLVGLLYGAYAFRHKPTVNEQPQQTTKVTISLIWLTSAICFLGTQFFCYYFDLGATGAAFYHGLSRYTWCLGLISLFHLCLNDLGGVVCMFLSSQAWATPSKLVFSTYLVHMSWLSYLFFSERQFNDYSPVNLSMLGLGSAVISLFLGFLFCLFFEAPFVKLGKVLLSQKPKHRSLL